MIGKSNIVGKPVANLLLDAEATVTVTHIYTENLAEIARKADVIVAAAGAPELVKGWWVKPGAVLIDVGISRITGEDGKERLVGDIAFDEVQHAKAVTPVPGGVGPMTIACLLSQYRAGGAEPARGTGREGRRLCRRTRPRDVSGPLRQSGGPAWR